jgi:hypothetical protein
MNYRQLEFDSINCVRHVGGYKYFIPSKRREIKFNNIREPMLKLKTHSGFHDLFRFWYVEEYKYGSILWLVDGNLYLRFRTISHSNMTSFFRFVNKRTIYQLGIISLVHAPVHLTDFFVVNVHVHELSSARIGQHKLCVTLSAR